MRFLRVFGVVCLSLQASHATAAPIAAYFAGAFGAVTLVSATAVDTGEDATGFIEQFRNEDDFNFFSEGSGDRSSYSPASAPEGTSRSWSGAVQGEVDFVGGNAWSLFETYTTYAFAYDADYCQYTDPNSPLCPPPGLGTLELTFDYYLEASAMASLAGDPGSGQASAGSAVQICYGLNPCGSPMVRTSASVSVDGIGPLPVDTDFTSETGSFSLILSRGDIAYVDIFVNTASGSADVFSAVAPVPLPAALPLLVAGVGAFGLVGRRRRVRASSA